ncbi:hypothetical protein [Paenibacillus silvae]|uniref:Death domain-containing protein n=1 Tax=Paenibacillus silvae TaxID=1325358 RepID=A0A2W6NNT9_9BACL|nr:hypothetical protein [Paenibacillus silvae]PZT57435.1 hypothetical protein DN757_01920 [Paenibacillus silvae]
MNKERKLSGQQQSLMSIAEKLIKNDIPFGDNLSGIEKKVLSLFMEGKSYRAIAKEVEYTPQRVGQMLTNNKRSIYSKLRSNWQQQFKEKKDDTFSLTREELLSELNKCDRDSLNEALKSLHLTHLKRLCKSVRDMGGQG